MVDVVGGQVLGCCVGGLVLDVPGKCLPSLVDWTLREAKPGQPRLSGPGEAAGPLVRLTEAACERYGLPARRAEAERLAGRLAEGRRVAEELARAEWRLTARGFGPWARIYRPAQGCERSCGQLCVPWWSATGVRAVVERARRPALGRRRPARAGGTRQAPGRVRARMVAPRGSAAVAGLELMTVLRPQCRASEPGEDGERRSGHDPGGLGEDPVESAPCEVPDGRLLVRDLPRFHQRAPAERLFEEVLDWARPLADDGCAECCLAGVDSTWPSPPARTVWSSGSVRRGTSRAPCSTRSCPVHGWSACPRVVLSRGMVGVERAQLDAGLLPGPFTPTGGRPTGPAWYETRTVACAVELG
ncbi:hypothetical protein [Streptomyces sp. NBC_01275]|uniref:hypothetical protein n=1 Tax=Streptomyces sp. NBC_01275 TaxID=2903807 RepID=UPI002B1E01A0|nr:hypothetical protein [Streptomyces sp. NBC_01275]